MLGMDDVHSIYVVDDDDAVRDSLAALLEPEGFISEQYSSPEAFVAALDCNPRQPWAPYMPSSRSSDASGRRAEIIENP